MIEKNIAFLAPYLKQEKILYLVMIGTGIFFSLFKIHDSVINRDAIVYLSTAENFLEHGLSGKFLNYGWLPYSIMGATLSKATDLSLESCFYIINTTLYILIPVIFVRIYYIATNNRDALPLIALFIMLLPSFNSFRDMIIRDVGFWCFSLLALLSFLRFIQTQKICYSFAWQLAIGMAFVFRLEAIVWLIGLPLILFWPKTTPFKVRIQHWLLSVSLYIFLILAIIVYLLINTPLLETLLNKNPVMSALTGAAERFNSAQNHMSQQVLNEYSKENVLLIYTFGLLAHFTYVVLSAVSLIYIVLSCAAILKHNHIKYSLENKVITWALSLSLLTLLAFLLSYQFMIERYAILSALLILILISQPTAKWIKTTWQASSPWIKCSTIFFAIVLLLDILTTKNPPPTNLKLAGEWLQENTSLQTSIALSDNRLLHYSGRVRQGVTCVIDKDLSASLKSIDYLHPYEYIVIHAKKKHQQKDTLFLDQGKTFERIKEFTHGNSVTIIYRNNNPESSQAADCNPFR